jgi:ROS/MUCR transcriptional regulator protein
VHPVAALEDGTALYAPLGELPYDPVEDLVQCHLCGDWHRTLGPHLRRHGWTADEYRRAVGLSPRRPLVTPSVSSRRATIARALAERDPRVCAGLALGVERARSGALPAAGTAVMSRELARPPLFELRRRQGRAIGLRRAETFRARREARARELGYQDLARYLHTRYVLDGAQVEDLARELAAASSAVIAEMDRAGIPRRPRGERTARAHAARRARRQRA